IRRSPRASSGSSTRRSSRSRWARSSPSRCCDFRFAAPGLVWPGAGGHYQGTSDHGSESGLKETDMVKTYRNFIGGEWVEPATGEYFENVNPADRTDVIGRWPRS